MSQTRRLAAILAADVAGYSRLMGEDNEALGNRATAVALSHPSVLRVGYLSSGLDPAADDVNMRWTREPQR